MIENLDFIKENDRTDTLKNRKKRGNALTAVK